MTPEDQITQARSELSRQFLAGSGLEVGAGARPFPLFDDTHVSYGDVRDRTALEGYFKINEVSAGRPLDAQTLAGIEDFSLDFLISAHVIEHLRDPIGAVVQAIRVLRGGGIHLLVVPDMRHTFDRDRSETTVSHAIADYADRGIGTCRQAYEEHLRHVHPIFTGQGYPEAEIQRQAAEAARLWPRYGAHFHAWTKEGFLALLAATQKLVPFEILHSGSAANENHFVLRTTASLQASAPAMATGPDLASVV